MGHSDVGESGESLSSYDRFTEIFRKVFDHIPEGREGGEQLLAVKQRKQHAAEYTLEFHSLTTGSGWNEPVLKAVSH